MYFRGSIDDHYIHLDEPKPASTAENSMWKHVMRSRTGSIFFDGAAHLLGVVASSRLRTTGLQKSTGGRDTAGACPGGGRDFSGRPGVDSRDEACAS